MHCSVQGEDSCLLKKDSQLVSLHDRNSPTSELVYIAGCCVLSEREASPGDSCVSLSVKSHIYQAGLKDLKDLKQSGVSANTGLKGRLPTCGVVHLSPL